MDEFERWALEWDWHYDNSGSYLGESWTWYNSVRYQVADWYVVLLHQPSGKVAAVAFAGLAPTEIWSGLVTSRDQLEAVMQSVAAFLRDR